jgi:hypothetical protein
VCEVVDMDPSHPQFALDVTQEEEDFGFGLTEAPSGVRVVVRGLGVRLQAVKVQTDDGSTGYAICDENLRPLYTPAKTLDELRRRFR